MPIRQARVVGGGRIESWRTDDEGAHADEEEQKCEIDDQSGKHEEKGEPTGAKAW